MARASWWIAVVFLVAGCGGGGGGGGGPAPTIEPASVVLAPGEPFDFTAAGGAGTLVWSATCGQVVGSGSTGAYVAPLDAGTCRVRVAGSAGPTAVSEAVVTVLSGDLGWVRRFGTPLADRFTAVAAAADGRAVAVGSTGGALFGSHAGATDAIVVALGPSGVVRWTRQFGTAVGDAAMGVALLPGGDAVVVGDTAGDLYAANQGFRDVFVVRLRASDGVPVWERQSGGAAREDVYDVAITPGGLIVVVGTTSGVLVPGEEVGGADGFVLVLSPAGGSVWQRQFGSPADDAAVRVAVAVDGRILVAGHTAGDLAGPPAGGRDAFVIAFSPDGDEVGRWQFGTASDDLVLGLAAAPDGGWWVAGATLGDLYATSAGGYDAFVAAFDATGALRWGAQEGSAGVDGYRSVAVDPEGRGVAVGVSDGALFGTVGNTGSDFVTTWYAADGTRLRGIKHDLVGEQSAAGVALGADGRVVVAGQSSGPALDGGALGGDDAVVWEAQP